MRPPFRSGLVRLALLLAPALGHGAEAKKPVWTPEQLKTESAACTEALVNGAWENTKRDQQLDPKMEMTPDIRKELAPQIAGMASLCECAVREASKKFSQDDAHRPEFQRFAVETVQSGKCKLPQ